MNRIFNYLSIIVSLVFFYSCDILENDASNISPLDTKINFRIIESYDTYETIETPKIFVELISEKMYPCSNFGIANSYNLNNKTIKVDIQGIVEPNVCLPAFGTAFGRIKIGNIEGMYKIQISGNGFSDGYNLFITDSLIIVDGEETDNTKPLIKFLYRYPKNTFSYRYDTTHAGAAIFDQLIDTLKTVINLKEFTFPDFARIPYEADFLNPYNNYQFRYFNYETEEEYEKIEEVIKVFKRNNISENSGVNFSIVNWMNKKYLSWLL